MSGNPSVTKEIVKLVSECKSQFKRWISDPKKQEEIINKIQEFYEKHKVNFDTVLSPDTIKIALCYSEIYRNEISFKDLVEFVKKTYSPTPGMKICILKNIKDELLVLDIMCCDENDDIIFTSKNPWCRMILFEMNEELVAMFGDKSMLVLK